MTRSHFTYVNFFYNYIFINVQEFFFFNFFWIFHDNVNLSYRALFPYGSWVLWLLIILLYGIIILLTEIAPYWFYFTWCIIMPYFANFYLVNFYFEWYYPFFLLAYDNIFLLRWALFIWNFIWNGCWSFGFNFLTFGFNFLTKYNLWYQELYLWYQELIEISQSYLIWNYLDITFLALINFWYMLIVTFISFWCEISYYIYNLELLNFLDIKITTCEEVYAYFWCKILFFLILFSVLILILLMIIDVLIILNYVRYLIVFCAQ